MDLIFNDKNKVLSRNKKIKAIKKQSARFLSLLLCLYLLLHLSTANSQQLIINSGTAEPFITADGGGFYGELVKEIFSRINIDAKVIRLPSKRSTLNANQGIDDGIIARTKGMEKKYPNLIRIPIPVITFKFVAYSLDRKIAIDDWKSLQPFSVGIIRGWQIYEKNVVDTKHLTTVVNAEQLFKLLMNKRSDLVLFEYYRGTWWNNHLNVNAQIIGSPLAEKDMFIYMNKKHIKLVPKITKAFEELKQDGTFERIKENTLLKALK